MEPGELFKFLQDLFEGERISVETEFNDEYGTLEVRTSLRLDGKEFYQHLEYTAGRDYEN
jgi:hypothetical protein